MLNFKRSGKKFMKKVASVVILLSLLLSLCSCGKYISSYKAIGLVRSQTSHSCEAGFSSLEGQLVFKIKKTAPQSEGDISYSIRVDKGEICLYYDIYGSKEELACVKAGESIEATGGYVEYGKTVYIIIEATEATEGKVSVELNR